VTLEEQCAACGAAFKRDAAFCAKCGRKRAMVEAEGLGFAVKLYLALLALQILLVVTVKAGADVFLAIAVGTGALGLITLAVAAVHRKLVVSTYTRSGFGPLGYVLILGAAPVIALVVSAYVHEVSSLFDVHQPSDIAAVEGHGLPALLGIVTIAPPLFEELAFRGLIYGALANSLRRSEALLISSFAFAIWHLSVPSLLTHVPLGLYFCWLRERSGSMYPSMLAHFSHNLCVVIAELAGWA
jgi:membrane protease YdiL (CAAX protease family)